MNRTRNSDLTQARMLDRLLSSDAGRLFLAVSFIVFAGFVVFINLTLAFADLQDQAVRLATRQAIVRTSPHRDNSAPSGVEGWKTYRNEEYGVEFKYPADWEITVDPRVSRVMAIGPTSSAGYPANYPLFGVDRMKTLDGGTIRNTDYSSVAQQINDYFGYDFLGTHARESSTVVVSGFPAIYVFPNEGLRMNPHIYVLTGTGLYSIFYTTDDKEGPRVNPYILATFKFIQ